MREKKFFSCEVWFSGEFVNSWKESGAYFSAKSHIIFFSGNLASVLNWRCQKQAKRHVRSKDFFLLISPSGNLRKLLCVRRNEERNKFGNILTFNLTLIKVGWEVFIEIPIESNKNPKHFAGRIGELCSHFPPAFSVFFPDGHTTAQFPRDFQVLATNNPIFFQLPQIMWPHFLHVPAYSHFIPHKLAFFCIIPEHFIQNTYDHMLKHCLNTNK